MFSATAVPKWYFANTLAAMSLRLEESHSLFYGLFSGARRAASASGSPHNLPFATTCLVPHHAATCHTFSHSKRPPQRTEIGPIDVELRRFGAENRRKSLAPHRKSAYPHCTSSRDEASFAAGLLLFPLQASAGCRSRLRPHSGGADGSLRLLHRRRGSAGALEELLHASTVQVRRLEALRRERLAGARQPRFAAADKAHG